MSRQRLTTKLTLLQALQGEALRAPSHIALIAGHERVSYAQLWQRVQALAARLAENGIRHGDRVVGVLWSQPEYAYLLFACAAIGAVFVPLPPRMRGEATEAILRRLDPKCIVASSELEIAGGETILARRKHERSGSMLVLRTGPDVSASRAFASWIEPGSVPPLTPPQVSVDDPAVILFTSGTTGEPKGIVHSHRSLIAPVVASARLREMWITFWPTYRTARRWLQVLLRYGTRLLRVAGRPQVLLSTMNMATISGLEAMLQALLMGDRLVLVRRFHPAQALRAVAREHVTVLIGTPLNFQAMLHSREFKSVNLSSLIICAVGAAPCPPALGREIQNQFRCAVHIGFGLTELGGGIAATSVEDSAELQAETVGRPMPGMEIRIVDEAGQPVPTGSVGELVCRSESRMLGYFGELGSGERVGLREDWVYTGDLATLDANGYLRIVGRKKDVIIRGGQNIAPTRIENALAQLPGIAEAAAVGVPDALQGEAIWVFVLRESPSPINETEVIEFCRGQLEAFEIPTHVRFLDKFPRAAGDKPKKTELRRMALEETHGRHDAVT